jgi:integrase/recombinase XerD
MYHFFVQKKYISVNPTDNIPTFKAEKIPPQILTNQEIEILLDQPQCKDFKGYRDKAMLEILYATGIRVSELIALELRDVNIQVGMLHLRSGKNERIIPMYPEAVANISSYVTNVRGLLIYDKSVKELFVNTNGKPMTRQGFWKIIKYYAQKANIKKDITPHTLRHSFAEHLLENGAPLSDIKEILGHADISSTQMYAQMMKNRYAQSYKKYHPMAK